MQGGVVPGSRAADDPLVDFDLPYGVLPPHLRRAMEYVEYARVAFGFPPALDRAIDRREDH
jgi:hypothetical protein